ncbi:hypothetical protein HK405_009662 [Cladochytrium tenue]|nr:hypothetical protein HK405_009662 [Cladochytrium tenue]
MASHPPAHQPATGAATAVAATDAREERLRELDRERSLFAARFGLPARTGASAPDRLPLQAAADTPGLLYHRPDAATASGPARSTSPQARSHTSPHRARIPSTDSIGDLTSTMARRSRRDAADQDADDEYNAGTNHQQRPLQSPEPGQRCYANETDALRAKFRLRHNAQQEFVDPDFTDSQDGGNRLELDPPSVHPRHQIRAGEAHRSQLPTPRTSAADATKRRVTPPDWTVAPGVSRATTRSDRTSRPTTSLRTAAAGRPSTEKRAASNNTSADSKKRSTSADAWKQLVTKEAKSRAKYHVSEATLYGLLEEERERRASLEADYHKLLAEVQALQTSHQQELRTAVRRVEADLRSLQKALILKTEECSLAQRDAAQHLARLDRDAAANAAVQARLEGQLDDARSALRDAHARFDQQQAAAAADLVRARAEAADRLAERDAADAAAAAERDSRARAEQAIAALHAAAAQRDDDLARVRSNAAQRATADAEELARARARAADAESRAADLAVREQAFLDELDAAAARERALARRADDIAARLQRATVDADRGALTAATDLDAARAAAADDAARAAVADAALSDARRELQRLQQAAVAAEVARDEARAEASAHADELTRLREQLAEVARRLDAELRARADAKRAHKTRLVAVAERVGDLQAQLDGTQTQLDGTQTQLEKLRGALRARDARATELEAAARDARDCLAAQQRVVDELRRRRQDDLQALQDRFGAARAALEADAASHRSLAAETAEALTRTRAELAEARAAVAAADDRDAAAERARADLDRRLRERDRDARVLAAKLAAAADRLRDADAAAGAARAQADARERQLARLQAGVGLMDRRLREQAGVLLNDGFDDDGDEVEDAFGGGGDAASLQLGTASLTSGASASSPVGGSRSRSHHASTLGAASYVREDVDGFDAGAAAVDAPSLTLDPLSLDLDSAALDLPSSFGAAPAWAAPSPRATGSKAPLRRLPTPPGATAAGTGNILASMDWDFQDNVSGGGGGGGSYRSHVAGNNESGGGGGAAWYGSTSRITDRS